MENTLRWGIHIVLKQSDTQITIDYDGKARLQRALQVPPPH